MSQRHATAETIYPTIGAWKVGRAIGMLMHSFPLPLGRQRLSTVLFALPVAPIAALIYILQKVVGVRYHVTNDRVEELPSIGGDVRHHVEIAKVTDATVDIRPGQAFHRAGDVHLVGEHGERQMTLAGVPRPERVRDAILAVAHSRRQLADVARVIAERPSVEELKANAAAEKAKVDAAKAAAAAKKAESSTAAE